MADEGGEVAARQGRVVRAFCAVLAVLCFSSAYVRLPGALYGEPAPRVPPSWTHQFWAPSLYWEGRRQATALVIVFVLFGLVFLYLALRRKSVVSAR
jgi:hypothetical protein